MAGAIGALLSLLPPSEGAPIFDPGRPPSAEFPIGVPPRHRFPSLLYERINEDYVARAPLGLPRLAASGGVSGVTSLPTSISGGVRREVCRRPLLLMASRGGLSSGWSATFTYEGGHFQITHSFGVGEYNSINR